LPLRKTGSVPNLLNPNKPTITAEFPAAGARCQARKVMNEFVEKFNVSVKLVCRHEITFAKTVWIGVRLLVLADPNNVSVVIVGSVGVMHKMLGMQQMIAKLEERKHKSYSMIVFVKCVSEVREQERQLTEPLFNSKQQVRLHVPPILLSEFLMEKVDIRGVDLPLDAGAK